MFASGADVASDDLLALECPDAGQDSGFDPAPPPKKKCSRGVLLQVGPGITDLNIWGKVVDAEQAAVMDKKTLVPVELEDRTGSVFLTLYVSGERARNLDSTECCPAWFAMIEKPVVEKAIAGKVNVQSGTDLVAVKKPLKPEAKKKANLVAVKQETKEAMTMIKKSMLKSKGGSKQGQAPKKKIEKTEHRIAPTHAVAYTKDKIMTASSSIGIDVSIRRLGQTINKKKQNTHTHTQQQQTKKTHTHNNNNRFLNNENCFCFDHHGRCGTDGRRGRSARAAGTDGRHCEGACETATCGSKDGGGFERPYLKTLEAVKTADPSDGTWPRTVVRQRTKFDKQPV